TSMKARSALLFVCLLSAAPPSFGEIPPAIDPKTAARYFEQLRQTASRDSGKTWGKTLDGPILFADPSSRWVVADRPDAQGVLQPREGVFVGTLPKDKNIANSALEWAGVRWTMVMWPVPEFRQPRERLLLHESFHRIQEAIGLPARDAVNDHLDTLEGRIWIQMEWRALERALRQPGDQRKEALSDALLFRSHRRSLFPKAAERENALEMNEGLAEYTGVKLSSASQEELVLRADLILRQARSSSTFARSFAYVSGPAYGALLDLSGKPWRRRLATAGDFGQLLEECFAIPKAAGDAGSVLRRYEGEEIVQAETKQEEKRRRAIADARKTFVDGPVLVFPLSPNVGYSYDPNAVLGIDASTVVYTPARIVDDWGVLEAEGGAWLIRDESGHFVSAHVPSPEKPSERPLKGRGWSLELKEGWTVGPGPRTSDLTVHQTR
ncbi:MAG TPA: hypothetical protein VGR00_10680, partial [Thermoanaerobaculia bacterium]|nr:hypothetical protein [Thermoanaerobaculia bacterium]